jgi:hypothetical protein
MHRIKQICAKHKVQPYTENIVHFRKRLAKAKDEGELMAIIKDIYIDGYEDGYLDSLNNRYRNVVKLNKED